MSTAQSDPDGWHWGIGERISDECVTYWFYSDLRYHYRGTLYTDPGQPWTAQIFEETGALPSGDVRVSEYPTRSAQFEDEADAITWIHDQMDDLLDY